MKQNKEAGFTLIEMLIVLMIITVLIILLIPNLSTRSEDVHSRGCQALVNTIRMKNRFIKTKIKALQLLPTTKGQKLNRLNTQKPLNCYLLYYQKNWNVARFIYYCLFRVLSKSRICQETRLYKQQTDRSARADAIIQALLHYIFPCLDGNRTSGERTQSVRVVARHTTVWVAGNV